MSGEADPTLEIRTDLRDGDHTVVAVRGEIDLATAPELERRLDEARGRGLPVIVDLSDVGFMDSSGFRILHRTADAIAVILVVPPNGPLRRVVGLAGLGEIMPVCDDVAGAREKARTAPR